MSTFSDDHDAVCAEVPFLERGIQDHNKTRFSHPSDHSAFEISENQFENTLEKVNSNMFDESSQPESQCKCIQLAVAANMSPM